MIFLIVVLIILGFLAALMIWGINSHYVGKVSDIDKNTVTFLPSESALTASLLENTLATALALFGHDQAKREEFASTVLGMIQVCNEKDVMILFNSGGYGSAYLGDSVGWGNISLAISDLLQKRGYRPFRLSYHRTSSIVYGLANELGACNNWNQKQISVQSAMLYLCLSHYPKLHVILCGESNGGYACYQTLKLLNHSRVFAVITGPPPWQRQTEHPRAFITRTNGFRDDSFSYLKIGTMLKENILVLLRLQKKVEGGKILNSIGSPGHIYGWEGYPYIQEHVTQFIKQNFPEEF